MSDGWQDHSWNRGQWMSWQNQERCDRLTEQGPVDELAERRVAGPPVEHEPVELAPQENSS